MHTKELAAVLRRAASLVGGPEALAARLGTSPEQIKRWIAGAGGAPTFVFLGAVDIIATHNQSETGERRRSTDESGERPASDEQPDQRAD
jgi:hypothetical protein